MNIYSLADNIVRRRHNTVTNNDGINKHAACIFDKNNTPISYGINHVNDLNKNSKDDSIHAEQHAFINAPNNNKKKLKDVNLLVVRYNKSFNLTNSFCCDRCIKSFGDLRKKGYRLKKVYWSTENGEIICQKANILIDLPKEDRYFTKIDRKLAVRNNL